MACLVCGSPSIRSFFELVRVPTQDGVLWPTAEEARAAPVGDIQLFLCDECGYVGNLRYDSSLVRFERYDVSLDHSPSFQRFLDGLCERLIETYGLRGGTVIDIGCGTGRFLRTLCNLGDNRGIGFDPSWSGATTEAVGRGIEFIPEVYSAQYEHLTADLISFRHLLDICDRPQDLLGLVRRAVADDSDAVVYCEVPNALRTFGDLVLWNIVYEHRSWFTEASLTSLFERAGFTVVDVAPCWEGEYIGLEARPSTPRVRPLDETSHGAVTSAVDRFSLSAAEIVDRWRLRLDEVRQSGRRVAAWGAGARAITFFALYPDAEQLVPTVVDINPARQGLFLPRTAHRIEPPERLGDDPPDVVLITNPTYEQEIVSQARALGLDCEFWTL